MSTVDETAAARPFTKPQLWVAFKNWMSRRRITISLVCFTALIVFNLAVVGTRPRNPFAVRQWQAAMGLALVVGGVAIRSWSAGTLHKSTQLTTTGPYALVRNPLYLGSFLMMYGFAVIMSDWLSPAFIAGPMSLLYHLQVRHEERTLVGSFPDQWPIYARQTPRFITCKLSFGWNTGWSAAQWIRNREYQAILGAMLGVIGLAVLNALGG